MISARSLSPCFLLVGLASLAAAEEGASDRRFLAGLRERGLYRLAETYCVERLKRPDLAESRRADLVIELSRSVAEQAASLPGKQRGPLWQRAGRVIEDFARQYPQSSRLPLVRLQGALGLLTRGELTRQEAQLTADAGPLLDEARSQLRAAIGQLGQLADEVERQLRERNLSGRTHPAQLSADQLASLKKNIQYQLARARRNQAQCYAADSADRANSLTRAIRLLGPLAKLDPADPLALSSRIDLIKSHRLLADYDAARRMLDVLLEQQPPLSVELRARAEQIRLALATGRLPEAISLLSQRRQIDGTTSAELDYAWLEAYLAVWRAADDAGERAKAAQWQAKATEMVERIEQMHGPYWTRRAGLLLCRYVRASPDGGNLAMLVRAAEGSFRSGRPDDALAAYDRAAALAAKEGDAGRAFELDYIGATIEHQRNRHRQASARYRQLSMTTPNHPKAAEAHRLAIYHAAQVAKGQPQGSLDQYVAMLQEHLQTWPNAPGSDSVRRRLGQLCEHRRDWPGAIGAYRAVSSNDANYLQVVRAATRCYRAWLEQCRAAGHPTEQIAGDAAGWLESLIVTPDGRLPEHWSPLHRFAALAAARLRLDYTSAGCGRADAVLSAALSGAGDAPAQWKSAAERTFQRIHAKALVEAGRDEEALAAYRALSAAYPRDGVIQEAYAQLLLGRDDRQSLETALAKWRELEKKSRSGSPRWFRAKYSIVWLHYRLGNKQQAAKIITLLQLLHPELGGPEMKARFVELLARCRQ